VTAALTSKAYKTASQDAAVQKRPKFLFDKMPYSSIPFLLPSQEGFEFLRNDLVQQRVFWKTRRILERSAEHALAQCSRQAILSCSSYNGLAVGSP
jgi:hypothetical protein